MNKDSEVLLPNEGSKSLKSKVSLNKVTEKLNSSKDSEGLNSK